MHVKCLYIYGIIIKIRLLMVIQNIEREEPFTAFGLFTVNISTITGRVMDPDILVKFRYGMYLKFRQSKHFSTPAPTLKK